MAQSTDSYSEFHTLLTERFVPLLRSDGFVGTGTTFRRLNGEAIHVVNIQGFRYGGRCCVNQAVHYTFMPTLGEGSVDAKKIKEYQCEFRSRLAEPGCMD